MSTSTISPSTDNIIDLNNSIDYTEWQKITLQIIPLFSGILSLCGSGLIIYYVIIIEHGYKNSGYHRLLLGMSIYDFISSIGIVFFGYWAMPKEAINYVVGAKGNFTTCEVAGFLTNFLFGSMWYIGFLSLYFVCTIRYEKSERWITYRIELIAHFVAIVTVLYTGINAIINELFNPLPELPGFCWFTSYPYECDIKDEIDCIRGDMNKTLWPPFIFYLLIIIWLIIIISMILIICKVRTTEQRLRQYAGGMNNNLERTKETCIQALLYIAAFFITYFPIILSSFIPRDVTSLIFFCAILIKLFGPMQGFFNAFIYFRKRFRSLTNENGPLQVINNIMPRLLRKPVLEQSNNDSNTTQQTTTRISNDNVVRTTATIATENLCHNTNTIIKKDNGHEEHNDINKNNNNNNNNIDKNKNHNKNQQETESCDDRSLLEENGYIESNNTICQV